MVDRCYSIFSRDVAHACVHTFTLSERRVVEEIGCLSICAPPPLSLDETVGFGCDWRAR